jgi:abortive infection bacteriophage resistance protein
MGKSARTFEEQLNLLKSRRMLFRDEEAALKTLQCISYYRLKGYWWDMQDDYQTHTLEPNTYFEDIINRYNFDRDLRMLLFKAIEKVEIALRTKMIHHLSLVYGGKWYLKNTLFDSHTKTFNGNTQTLHQHTIQDLKKEFNRSNEIFIKSHKRKHPGVDPDSWKILEVASLGVLSKLYKCLRNQLPEKSKISKEFGLNISTELSSWLEAITYIRNIIAHHSRIWSRNMVKIPKDNINNPLNPWLNIPLKTVQQKKAFLIISCLAYMCYSLSGENEFVMNIKSLFHKYPTIPIYKLGFLGNWEGHPIWSTT